jgi:hypothetical protein
MPNITLYIATEEMPSAERLARLSRDCVGLCTQVLQAVLNNVHIVYIAVRHGHGHPVFAEVRYRLEPFRTSLVMDAFMDALDAAIKRHTGLTARIRCFAYAPTNIYARN